MLWTILALAATPESIWLEAENFGPLSGSNFTFMSEDRQTNGSWSIAGPGVADAWTQGGESEFMSIAARADEAAGVRVDREVVVPTGGSYTLWVRYADYRAKDEEFVVHLRQGAKSQEFRFGLKPIVDELDPMKLLWDWAYGWSSVPAPLERGPVTVEIEATGPTGARRNVDCLCLTNDPAYHPNGREKPAFPSWAPLDAMRRNGMPDVEPLATPKPIPPYKGAPPPSFLWNVGKPWADELAKPIAERIESPFSVDPPLLADFLAKFKGGSPPVYSDPLSGPVWHIPQYPAAFANGSPFLEWLQKHPASRFAVLLNYGEPVWPEGADRKAIYSNFKKFGKQFDGFIAGENLSYANVDQKAFEAAVRAAKSRKDVLEAIKKYNTDATVAKFSGYFGTQITPAEGWGGVDSCLSANNESLCHALCSWGVRRIGHENSANSPTLSRRLAFLRGAARQFGCQMVDYQSANLGDSATMFSREAFFFPASSRYILDNSYDAWAGAGTNWLMKDYLLWYLAGANAFYNEQGVDIFWKPGGNSAGDAYPVQLSPKGKVAEAVQKVVGAHPRPVPYAPIAFLLDEAHGWSQERFQPGAFALEPSLNPFVLRPGRHEASLRGWFDVAYYPAPETQNEPATAIRQTFVNGIFGDIFDVIVTSPKRSDALSRYPVVIAAGEVTLDKEWGSALENYVMEGGTFVASVSQLTGSVPTGLKILEARSWGESAGYNWMATTDSPSATYAFSKDLGDGRALATTPAGEPLAILRKVGKGQVIEIGVPLGLGLDDRPVPFLGNLMQHLTQGLTPIKVRGDVEWTLGQLPDGGWLVGLFNNRGINKPQHGVNPTDLSQSISVSLKCEKPIGKVEEWMTGQAPDSQGSSCNVIVPAGAVRLVAVYPNG